MKFKILNTKEVKRIKNLLKEEFGYTKDLNYTFLINKDKLFIVSNNIKEIDLGKLKINTIGLYFGRLNSRIRLSIEGSQIIGKYAKKNVLELNEDEAKRWMAGEDLIKNTKLKNFVIIKNKNDFLGCGKITNEKILNYVPKERRV